MTHDPQLVETIARAIHGRDTTHAALWHWDELGEPDRDCYRNMARAALDAMPTTFGQAMLDDAEAEIQQLRAEIAALPQPIGYGIVTADEYIIGQLDGTVIDGIGWAFESDDARLVDTQAEAGEQAAEYADGRAVVVALVPVDRQ